MDKQNLLALRPLLFIWRAGRNAGVLFGNISFNEREELWVAYVNSGEPYDLTPDWKYRTGPLRMGLEQL